MAMTRRFLLLVVATGGALTANLALAAPQEAGTLLRAVEHGRSRNLQPDPEDLDPDWAIIQDSRPELDADHRFQPMIIEGETGFWPSSQFLRDNEALVTMNDVAYQRGKACGLKQDGRAVLLPGHHTGWDIHNLQAISGGNQLDLCAGFVAHHRQDRIIAIVMRGSIGNKWTGGDWLANRDSVLARLEAARTPEGEAVPLKGAAHRGILKKYLSCRQPILAQVDHLLASMSPEEREDTRFYVTGHSQGAALATFIAPDLCDHLRRHYPHSADNAVSNRVQAWLLAAPMCLDSEGAAHVESLVGHANILRQNTFHDVVPNFNVGWYNLNSLLPSSGIFKSVGTLMLQDSSEAMRRHVAGQPGPKTPPSVLDPIGWNPGAYINACHMSIRGFDPRMVNRNQQALHDGLMWGYSHQLQKARDQGSFLGRYLGWVSR